VFMGSMNAMPMMYALELKKLGYNVLYFVDAPISDALSRPENHFKDIEYPYPEWIVEFKIPTQMVLPYFSRFFASYLLKKIEKKSNKKVACFVLNGFFVSISPYLQSAAKVVSLSHGSDLDVWANRENASTLALTFCRRSIFKYFPKAVSVFLIKKAVNIQYHGFAASNAVIYFPAGFNRAGDEVIESLAKTGVSIFNRYDISFEPLKDVSRDFKNPENKTVIFSGVRFLYKTFPDGNDEYSKGNDLIIQGLARYYQKNKNIEIHFVEKGEDVEHAKSLCHEFGIDEVVIWHKEMPFKKLLNLYVRSDICFDQVGKHWIGAIGAYALFLGKPLVANVKKAVALDVFPKMNPILSVETEGEIFDALIKLEDMSYRREIHLLSKTFVEKQMYAGKLLHALFAL
jgi:hypothetical protein